MTTTPSRDQVKHDAAVALAGPMAERFEAHFGQSWTDPMWRDHAATWAAAWKAAQPQAAPQPEAPMLPRTDSTVAAIMIDTLLEEYGYPSNSKNAARAGYEAASRWLRSTAAQPTQAQPVLPPWWSDFITRICELPDRNSPEDEPEAMVATAKELENCALNAIDEYAALSAAPHPTGGKQE